MMQPIQYDRPSDLYKSTILQAIPRTGTPLNPPNHVYDGTLADCIREFSAQPASQQTRCHLQTEAQEALDNKTLLSSADMVAIASRDDFPKE